MRKVEINNEIVLMRQPVRQARICVINKLIREAKKLRTSSHGSEKQMEKNKNKADKLLREVFALRHIKEDEISKFGISSVENLQEILQNSQTDDGTKAMVKVVRYKSLSSRIIEFREKFPDYSEHISWKRKRRAPKRKENCTMDLPQRYSKQLRNDTGNETKRTQTEGTKDAVHIASIASVSCEKETKSDDKFRKSLEEREANKGLKGNRENLNSVAEVHGVRTESKSGRDFENVTKIISSEATVKRFTEILQETKEQHERCKETRDLHSSIIEVETTSKEMDDFFLHANQTTAGLHTVPFPKEKNRVHNVNRDALSSYQIRSKNKLYEERGSKERKYNGRENMNDDEHVMGETSNMRFKQNKKDTEIEEKKSCKSTSVAENESLHPSWAAKKKQQHIMKQGFQGKKIKFDED